MWYIKKKGKEKEIKEKEEKEKIKYIYFLKPQNIEYYYNQIKEKLRLKTINYYQFFSFVNILSNQLKIFTKNEYLKPKNLVINKALHSRKILYKNLIEFSKICSLPSYSDYQSYSFFQNYINLKDYNEDIEIQQISDYYYLGKKLSFKDIPPALVLFNKDYQSLSIITKEDSIIPKEKKKLFDLWNAQNPNEAIYLINYNKLSQEEFQEQVLIYFNINNNNKN